MRRKLLYLLPVLSLVLCLLVAIAWVGSVGHVGSGYWVGPRHDLVFSGTDGVLGVSFARDSGLRPPVPGTDRLYGWFFTRFPLPPGRDRASLSTLSFNSWGFGFHVGQTVGRPRGWWRFGGRTLTVAYVPFWLPLLALALPPLWTAAAWVARRGRRRSGRCANCGYDLRATPDRCPECGSLQPPHNPPMQRTATASSGAVE